MVKINGKYNSTGGFDFIPGATYVGDSRMLGLAIFLDQYNSSRVMLRFKDHKIRKIDYREFSRAVSFLEAFSAGEASSYESPDPNPLRISVVMFENSRILMRWDDSSTVLLPLEFFQTLNVLVAIRKKMESIVYKNLERNALLNRNSFLEQFKNWSGLFVFVLLSVLDVLLLLCLFIWPDLHLHWLALTLTLAFWLLVLKPDWSDKIWPAIQAYLDEEFLTDLSNLHFPKRSVEIFLILLTLAFLYFFFGSDAANMILKYYKASPLP
ncbi:MAG: hypothetical protein ACD_39C00072G0002 [uncultured bacterium]|nr:MAG: hypothetical protein ACD_39C00072G0002 [uncultured bacterium]